MSKKSEEVFIEENNKLQGIYKDLGIVSKNLKEKIDKYNNTGNRDINTYKTVDETGRMYAIQQSKALQEIKAEPYYARMDLIYSGEKEVQEIYIGRNEFTVDNDIKIVSWAAPIADVFNNGLGSFSKTIIDKKEGKRNLSGEKILKRKIIIKNGELQNVISEGDADYAKAEEQYIKEKLGSSSNNKLNDILDTMQQEQNIIIRLPINESILIRGCAGSGKSSVMYHRVAQLIYNHDLKYDEVLAIVPNKLFMNYTKTITTDLGMKFDIKQVTFTELTKEMLKDNFKHFSENMKSDLKSNVLKTSFSYKQFLDKYINYLDEKIISKANITFAGHEIISYHELKNIWDNQFAGYKLNSKINKFKDYVRDKLKNKKELILDSIEKYYESDEDILREYCKSKDMLEKQIQNLKREKIIKRERVSVQFDLITEGYLESIRELDVLEIYLELISNANLIEKLGEDIFTIGELDLLTGSKLNNELSYIESIPVLYLYIELNDVKANYRHIALDECQDLSMLELIIIEKLTKSFTFSGDFNQRIVYDKDSITLDYIKNIFSKHTSFQAYILNKSFRNSKSITNYSNEIIKPIIKSKNSLPVAFNRDTHKPLVMKINNNAKVRYISEFLRDKNNSGDSIAIIFRDKDECKKYHKLISKEFTEEKIGLLMDNNTEINERINIISAPLSKGLEFKTVIIGDGEIYENTEENRNLLYVQCTRALDRLIILCSETLPDILNSINNKLYELTEYINAEELNSLRICAENVLLINIQESKEEVRKIINSINDTKKLAAIVGEYYNIKKLSDLEKYL